MIERYEYDRSSTKEKWTIMKYMNDFNLMTMYASVLRSSNELTRNNISTILREMEQTNVYKPRRGGGSIDTGKFKIIQIAWYMFGYYDKNKKGGSKRFVFTPLGNLLLDNLHDRNKASKIFLTMLFGNAFRQPFSKMKKEFNLYPFRLVFKLLCDPRLSGKLYNDEVFYFVMFCKTIDADAYELIIEDILNFRKLNSDTKFLMFKENESVIAQALHEWSYATVLLDTAGIIKIKNDSSNKKIGVLVHGNSSGRRMYRENYIVLENSIKNYLDILLENYSCYDKPFDTEMVATKFDDELIIKLYSFYPIELLSEIGVEEEEREKISALVSIVNSVEEYANNVNKNDCYRFEDALEEAFNLFKDVRAKKVGGASKTDVECLFYPLNFDTKRFNVEAKARRVKLNEINASRLKKHREDIGAKYTLIVTPDYTRMVLEDIKKDDSAIIKSATLSNYLYQYITKYGHDMSYDFLDSTIQKNLGKDITNIVNEHIYSHFGHSSNL